MIIRYGRRFKKGWGVEGTTVGPWHIVDTRDIESERDWTLCKTRLGFQGMTLADNTTPTEDTDRICTRCLAKARALGPAVADQALFLVPVRRSALVPYQSPEERLLKAASPEALMEAQADIEGRKGALTRKSKR